MKKTHCKETIPVFFAADNGYAPYISVSVDSLAEHVSPSHRYAVYILHAGLNEEATQKLCALSRENVCVQCVDISDRLQALIDSTKHRDVYLGATHYRLFIADLFPQYDKAVYLDGDTVVNTDIEKLYRTDIGGCLVGAANDEYVFRTTVLRRYAAVALGILPQSYFNDGVLLLNLRTMRNENFYARFVSLLQTCRYMVAQAKDIWNVLCRDRVYYFAQSWNTIPQSEEDDDAPVPKIVHFAHTFKPWHYDGIAYRKYFWQFAARSPFLGDILSDRLTFTPECAALDAETSRNEQEIAKAEIDRCHNHIKARAVATGEVYGLSSL